MPIIKITIDQKIHYLNTQSVVNAVRAYQQLGIAGEEGACRSSQLIDCYKIYATDPLEKNHTPENEKNVIRYICATVFRMSNWHNRLGEIILQYLNLSKNELHKIQMHYGITVEEYQQTTRLLNYRNDGEIFKDKEINFQTLKKNLNHAIKCYLIQAERPAADRIAAINLIEHLKILFNLPLSLHINQKIMAYTLALFKVVSTACRNNILNYMNITLGALNVIATRCDQKLLDYNITPTDPSDLTISLTQPISSDLEKQYSLFSMLDLDIAKQTNMALQATQYYLTECNDVLGKFGKHDCAGFVRAKHLEAALLSFQDKLNDDTDESSEKIKEFYTTIFALIFESGSRDLKKRILWGVGLNEYQLKYLQVDLKITDAAIAQCAKTLNHSPLPNNKNEWRQFKKKLEKAVQDYYAHEQLYAIGKRSEGQIRAKHFTASLRSINLNSDRFDSRNEGRDLLKLIYLLMLHTQHNFTKRLADRVLHEILWTPNQIKILPDAFPFLCGDFRNLTKTDANEIFTDWERNRDDSNFTLVKETENIKIASVDYNQLKSQLILAINAFQKSCLGNEDEKRIASELKRKIESLIEISSHEERATLVLYATYCITTIGIDILQDAILDFIAKEPLLIEKKALYELKKQYGLPNVCYRKLKDELLKNKISPATENTMIISPIEMKMQLSNRELNEPSSRSFEEMCDDIVKTEENWEAFSNGMLTAATRYLITERTGITGTGEVRAFQLRKAVQEITNSRLSSVEKEIMLIHMALAVTLYSEPKSTVLCHKVLIHVGVSMAKMRKYGNKYTNSKQLSTDIAKKLIATSELNDEKLFFASDQPNLSEFERKTPISINYNAFNWQNPFWTLISAPECIITDWSKFQNDILSGIATYLSDKNDHVDIIINAVKEKKTTDKQLTGVLKALNLRAAIEDIGNLDDLQEKKKLILYACSFVLFANSGVLKTTLINQTGVNDTDFMALKKAWCLDDDTCKNQAKRFEKLETLKMTLTSVNEPMRPANSAVALAMTAAWR